MRIILYTGKGGVGKTSIAAATAVKLSAGGLKTLIMSTDAAHSLGDVLEVELGNEPQKIQENLWGLEVNSLREAERNWGSFQTWLSGFMQWANLDELEPEELLVFPGLEELFSLMQIQRQAATKQYDVIIVDCAPTGETLRLLSFSDAFHWWIERMFPYKKRMVRLARPVVKAVGRGFELPPEEAMGEFEVFMNNLRLTQELLLDRTLTSVRLVLTPEKIVIAETRRTFTYLNLFGFNTDAVIVNRVLPESVASGYLKNWVTAQAKYLEDIEASFAPLPLLQVPFMPLEVAGITMLEQVADAAFKGVDPMAVLHDKPIEEIEKVEDDYLLKLSIPLTSKEEIDLSQKGDELTVHVGWHKRKVILPRKLLDRPILGATLKGDILTIRFGARADDKNEVES